MGDSDSTERGSRPVTPLESLGVLASQEVSITESLRHLELYTTRGLLSILWHGTGDERVALL